MPRSTSVTIGVTSVASAFTQTVADFAGLTDQIFMANRPAFLQVVSNDAPAYMKESADLTGSSGTWLCDGVDDDVQINAALAAATGSGGESMVLLSGGRFFCGNSVLMQSGTCLHGSGQNTALTAVSLTTSTGFGSGVAVVKNALVSTHAHRITNLQIDGNAALGGATASAVWYESSSSSNDASGYPDTNPDPDLVLDHLLVRNFGNGTNRHGIVATTDCRGTQIETMQMRSFSGHGIWFTASPDSHIVNVHMGGTTGNGFYIQGGNVKLANCKAYFADDAAFRITSGRGSIVGCEAQDSNIGYYFDASPMVVAGIVADTSQTDGVVCSAQQMSINSMQVFTRAGGRYATCARGLNIDAVYSDYNLTGVVDPSSITTPVQGFANLTNGSRNFARVSNGSSLLSVG